MKLLLCRSCGDIFSLRQEDRTCFCGETSGKYTDEINAIIRGPCVPLGIANSSFRKALMMLDLTDMGINFEAFVIDHKKADTICGSSITEET